MLTVSEVKQILAKQLHGVKIKAVLEFTSKLSNASPLRKTIDVPEKLLQIFFGEIMS